MKQVRGIATFTFSIKLSAALANLLLTTASRTHKVYASVSIAFHTLEVVAILFTIKSTYPLAVFVDLNTSYAQNNS